MSQVGRAREVVYARVYQWVSEIRTVKCKYSFVYIVVAVTCLRQEGRKICETRAHSPHAK
jgi:hypothetical protein